jgi:hypothetical protein
MNYAELAIQLPVTHHYICDHARMVFGLRNLSRLDYPMNFDGTKNLDYPMNFDGTKNL